MPEIEGRYTVVHGVRTYYERCGSGIPILLIHTAGRDGRQWHGVMQELGSKFCLFAPDLPGHGKSWPLADNTCLNDAQAIVHWFRDFMDAVCGKPFVVMGCSIGGKLSLLMGALFDQIRAVISMQGADAPPSSSGFSEASLDVMIHPQNNLTHSQMEFTMSLLGDECSPEGRRFTEWGVLSLIPLAQQGDLRAYSRCDLAGMTEKITCPVLLVHGSQDWIVSREMVDITYGHLTNAKKAELVSLSGIGHFPHVEDPQRTAVVASHFLAEVLS